MTLDEFRNGCRTQNPLKWDTLGASYQQCEWIAPDGRMILIERARFPRHIFKEPGYVYWGEVIYADLALAEREAEQFGGEVVEGFYCDPDAPLWFISFDDLDKALAYAFEHWQKN